MYKFDSQLEHNFYRCLQRYLPDYLPDHHDYPVLSKLKLSKRRYRYDFVWLIGSNGVVVEIQGGLQQENTEHRNTKGVVRDCNKNILAQLNGFISLQVPGHFYRQYNGYLNDHQRIFLNYLVRALIIKYKEFNLDYQNIKLNFELKSNTHPDHIKGNLPELANEVF